MKDFKINATKYASYIGYIGCTLLLIGVFLPFISVNVMFLDFSVNYIQGDGKFILFFAIATASLIFFKKPKLSYIPIVLSILILGYDLINSGSIARNYFKFIELGIGVYVLILGIVLCLIYAMFYKKKGKDELLVDSTINSPTNTVLATQPFFNPDEIVQDCKFCVDCGAKLPLTSEVCFMCGKKI